MKFQNEFMLYFMALAISITLGAGIVAAVILLQFKCVA